MKVITLKQPWATLISEGYKVYEFRSWKTNYRGELYIHAGKGIDKKAMNKIKHLNLEFPQSRIVARVTLKDCIKLEEKIGEEIHNKNNLIYGIHTDGYAWLLDNVEKINSEEVINGKLGLWNLEKEK